MISFCWFDCAFLTPQRFKVTSEVYVVEGLHRWTSSSLKIILLKWQRFCELTPTCMPGGNFKWHFISPLFLSTLNSFRRLCLVCLKAPQMLLCFVASSPNRKAGFTPGYIPVCVTGMSDSPMPRRASPSPPPLQVETQAEAADFSERWSTSRCKNAAAVFPLPPMIPYLVGLSDRVHVL